MGAGRPQFTVISGHASAEEVAAVVTALTVAAGAGGAGPGRAGASRARGGRGVRAWADRAAMLREPLHPGPEGWRASARPS